MPATSSHQHGLNAAQRRALTTVLTRLEQAIRRWEEQLGQEPTNADLLTRHINQPTPDEQVELRRLLAQLRQEINALAQEFQLTGSEVDMRRALAAEFATLWADLEDTRPATLSRYGPIDPALETTLGPHIDALIHLVLDIQHRAEQQPEVP